MKISVIFIKKAIHYLHTFMSKNLSIICFVLIVRNNAKLLLSSLVRIFIEAS